MAEEYESLIALGSNLGDRENYLGQATRELAQISLALESSPWYETPPYGGVSDRPFLNGALWLRTKLNAAQLLAKMHEIEGIYGRTRELRWANRSLDLDLILMQDSQGQSIVLKNETMTLPHPECHLRSFVLAPLCWLRPHWVHPGLKKRLREILTDQ